MWQREIKVADRIKAVIQITLIKTKYNLDYPGGPNAITRVPKIGIGRSEREMWVRKKDQRNTMLAGFEDTIKGGQEPRNVGGLWKLKKVRKWTLFYYLQHYCPLDFSPVQHGLNC